MGGRPELPLGHVRTVRERGRKVKQIKVRMDGPDHKRWMRLARYQYIREHGSVPEGKRVVFVGSKPEAVNADDVLFLFDAIDKSVAAGRKAAAKASRELAAVRRQISILKCQWYPVCKRTGVVVRRPYPSRVSGLISLGYDVEKSCNGRVDPRILESCPYRLVMGRNIDERTARIVRDFSELKLFDQTENSS